VELLVVKSSDTSTSTPHLTRPLTHPSEPSASLEEPINTSTSSLSRHHPNLPPSKRKSSFRNPINTRTWSTSFCKRVELPPTSRSDDLLPQPNPNRKSSLSDTEPVEVQEVVAVDPEVVVVDPVAAAVDLDSEEDPVEDPEAVVVADTAVVDPVEVFPHLTEIKSFSVLFLVSVSILQVNHVTLSS